MPADDTPFARYAARVQRVMAHIDRHLDGDLDLTTLSGVAAFSPQHFHRQFRTMVGMPLLRYVQLARMKRAAAQLAYRGDSVTAVALDAGYEAPDSFARAFRQRIGQAPAAFRTSPDWAAWQAAIAPLAEARNRVMIQQFSNDDVAIREVAAVTVAVMRHRGAPHALGDTIRRFIDWRKSNGVHPSRHATYTIWHGDPDSGEPDAGHTELATELRRPLTDIDRAAGLVPGTIPAGRCAVLRVIGPSDNLRPAGEFLYGTWLPTSGEELRDFPIYAQRIRFYPDVPELEAITDVFLPLR